MQAHNLFEDSHIHDNILETIRQIQRGEIKVGDVVYDKKLLKDVIVLDLPELKDISKCDYTIFPMITNKCQTLDGKIEVSSYVHFAKISNGKFFSEYEINEKDKEKVYFFEFLARKECFRVEKIKKKDGYILKFFGDSQQRVNDFIEDALYTRRFINP